MDSIYEIYNRQASSKINVKDYFEEFSKVIQFPSCYVPVKKQSEESILDIMQAALDPDKFKLIANYCSPDQLKLEGEESSKTKNSQRMRAKNIYTAPEIPSNTNLHTIYELKKRLAKTPKCQSLKYKSEVFINYEQTEKPNCPLARPGKDILIYIRVYQPFVYTPNGLDQNIPKVRLNSIIAMLGSQTLAELRDKINCTSDLGICIENSDKSNRKPIEMAKDVYKSGFFFIENTFYNDFRDTSCIDYSDVIRNWAESKKIGPLHTSTMEYTRVDSLRVRFGFPWVYQHQGNCEHLIVFSDARLINPDDELAVPSYPRIHRLRPRTCKFCMTCGVFPAYWITMENDRVPHNPCYFCETCYDSFNYIDDEKIGNFQAYTFPSYTKFIDALDDECDDINLNEEIQ